MNERHKYKEGDIVRHKTGGPKMIIIGLSWYNSVWDRWQFDGSWFIGKREYLGGIGYECRYFIPKTADIKVAQSNANNFSNSTAIAEGQGSYESKNFFEYELTKIKR